MTSARGSELCGPQLATQELTHAPFSCSENGRAALVARIGAANEIVDLDA